MKDFTKENEETAQPPEPQGVEAPEPEFLEDEEQEEAVQWDGSDAEIVSEGADQEYKDTITGVKLSYVLTEEEIRTCMRGTQFGKRRKRRMRIKLVVFSALLLGFLVFFFLKRNPDNLFFATVCAAMIFIMIFLPDIRIKQDAKRMARKSVWRSIRIRSRWAAGKTSGRSRWTARVRARFIRRTSSCISRATIW